MQKITNKLTKQLAQYGALTTALVAGVDATGQIVYTDENPDFVGGLSNEYFLDINNDGINDLRFFGSSDTYNSTYSFRYIVAEGLNSTRVQANGNSYNAGALNAGDLISSGQSFIGNGSLASSNNFSSCDDEFCEVTDKYLGVQFDIGTDTHYGWVRLDVSISGGSWIIKDYAYESTPDIAIQAGEGIVNTWNGMAWSLGAPPTNIQEVIIDGAYDTGTNGSFTAQKLTVNTGNILTVAPDTNISVDDDIIVDGTLNIGHTGSVVQVNDTASVTNNGSIDVAVDTPNLDTGDFMILGSPMTGETREDVWNGAFNVQQYTTANFVPNVAVGASGVIYNFSCENIDDWNAYMTGALTPGEGFLIFPQTGLTAPGGIFNYNYNTGTLNTGVITRPLVFNTATENSPNMLSNPYPSGIDAAAFLAANPQIDAVYFWDHLSDPSPMEPGPYTNNYDMDDISLVNAMGPVAAANGGVAPTGVIATAQGFSVFASGAGTATFNNSMRVTTGNTTLRSAEATDNRNRFWLQVKSEAYGVGSNALVGFTENATADYDAGYDSPRLTTIVSLHSNIEGDMENGYIIQGREAFNANMKIPFSFSTDIDENTAYRISLSDFDGDVWNTATIYLIDHVTGVITNLSENEYVFNSEMGNFKGRFSIQFRDASLGTNNLNLLQKITFYPNPTTTIVNIVSPNALVSGAVVTDIQGRVIENVAIDNVNNYVLDMSKLGDAIYFVTVTTDAGTITKRVIKK